MDTQQIERKGEEVKQEATMIAESQSSVVQDSVQMSVSIPRRVRDDESYARESPVKDTERVDDECQEEVKTQERLSKWDFEDRIQSADLPLETQIIEDFSFRPLEDEIAPLPQDIFLESTAGYQNNLLYQQEVSMGIEEYKTLGFGDGNEIDYSQPNFTPYTYTGKTSLDEAHELYL